MSKIHVLKTWLPFWDAVESGAKTFEVRRDDRGFAVGDCLVLRAVLSKPPHELVTDETGRPCDLSRRVSYVLPGGQFGVESGFVVLGLTDWGPAE